MSRLEPRRAPRQGELPPLPLGPLEVGGSIRESLRPGSPALTAMARGGIAVVIAGGIGTTFGPDRAHWAMAAAILVLHEGPARARSWQRGIERTPGTLAGLGPAGLILALHPGGLWRVALPMLLPFVIDLRVPRNHALAALLITAIALAVGTGGHAVADPGRLLWARAAETVTGCLTGLIVHALTARRSPAPSIRQELARTLTSTRAVPACLAHDEVSTPAALKARRDLQRSLFALVMDFETQMGGATGRRSAAAPLWPAVVAAQRLGCQLPATCGSLEEAGDRKALGAPSELAQIDAVLADMTDAWRAGAGPRALPQLPEFLQAEIIGLNSTLVRGAG